MEYMSFKCGQCGNWYTPVPMPEDMMCATCAEGKHALHPKKGTYDCHWGHLTATNSEVKMAELRQQVVNTQGAVSQAVAAIGRAETQEVVTSALTTMEQQFAQLERALGGMPEILRWAGVKTMPGLKGSPNNRRFLALDAVEHLVEQNRRPPTDVVELKRSVKTCTGIADEITGMVAGLRVSLSQARRQAETWVPPADEEPELSMTPAAIKQREYREAKRRELAEV